MYHRGRDAEIVLVHRDSGHYLETVPMVNGQADMDPLRTARATPPKAAMLNDLRMARATPKTAILRDLPLALATQKAAILHELPLALATQTTAILHELPLVLATPRTAILHELPLALATQTILRELLNMIPVARAILEDLLNMALATAQTATLGELLNMTLAAKPATDPPPPPPHTIGNEVDHCIFHLVPPLKRMAR